MMVRGEPDYVDQVPRREVYEAAHPNVEIIYIGPYWQAIVSEGEGKTIITRHGLKQLLDKLEALDSADGGKPGDGGRGLPIRATPATSASRWKRPAQHGRRRPADGPSLRAPSRLRGSGRLGAAIRRPCWGRRGAGTSIQPPRGPS